MHAASRRRPWLILIGILVLQVAAGAVVRLLRRGDSSRSCQEYYAGMRNPPEAAVAWCRAGRYFSWTSTLPENAGHGALNIFTVSMGNPHNPAIVLIHGYPTSSCDFSALAQQLSADYYLCALDTPGYGFSDKPRPGYRYSIVDDARLVDYFIREIAGLKVFALLTHDRGDSVGLALLHIYQAYESRPYTITHHLITNGNIYLPLARLSRGQRLLLNPITGPIIAALSSGATLARGMTGLVYTPPLSPDEVATLASIFDYQDGSRVQHAIIQYLNERTMHEIAWLETLARSAIPTTLIWGEQDPIAPVAVADHVWAQYLTRQPTPARSWRIPCANHYLQHDQPQLLAALVHATLAGTPDLREIAGASCKAVRVG